MSIKTQFDNMLNEYLTLDLMKNEIEDRAAIYKALPKDNGWKGGTLPVPIQGTQASSIAYDKYTAEDDISFDEYLRGEVSGYKTLTYALAFRHKDIVEHNSIKKNSFLRVMTNQVENSMNFLKNAMDINLMNGGWYDRATADGTAAGVIAITSVQRFKIGQKLNVGASGATVGYVTAIDKSAKTITLSDARTGGSVIDLSSIVTAAADNKIYLDGQFGKAFFSIREALLPASLSGSDTLHGIAKSTNPNLQSMMIDGSGAFTAASFIDDLFDAYTTVRTSGEAVGRPKAYMNWIHLAKVMKKLENAKVGFRVTEGSRQDSLYGVTEMELFSVAKGEKITVVGLPNMDTDFIAIADVEKNFGWHSNGGIRKVETPDGDKFHTVRGTDGYKFICDYEVFGDLTAQGAGNCGVIHSIA